MRYVSLFSGIEAATVAWEPLGWEPVAFAEVEPFPCAVLAHRWPHVPNLGDVREIDWKEFVESHGAVDVVVGGSPCQSFSVAGGRESLDGESRLMFEYIRAVREVRPRWFLWENVPGALSTRDNAFGQLLGEMADLGYGLAWRVLDAQFFGVAQRRRRVFLVGCAGGRVGRAAAVLFDAESVRGNTLTSREKSQELAGAAEKRPGVGGGGGCLTPWDVQSKRIFKANSICPTLSSGTGEGMNIQPCVLQADAIDYKQTPKVMEGLCHTLTHEGEGGVHSGVLQQRAVLAFNDGQVTSPQNGNIPKFGDACHTLSATDRPPAIALQTDQLSQNGTNVSVEICKTLDTASATPVVCLQTGDDLSPTLTARHDSSPCTDRGQTVVCVSDDQANAAIDNDLCGSLKVGGGSP